MLHSQNRLLLIAIFILVILIVVVLDILPTRPQMVKRQNDIYELPRETTVTRLSADEELIKMNMGRPWPNLRKSPYRYKFHSVEDIKRFVRSQLESNSNPSLMQITRKQYLINCSNVDEIVIGKMLGHGKYKSTYLGTFRGLTVAVKVVTRRFGSNNACAKTILSNLLHASIHDIKHSMYFTRCKHNSPMDSVVYEIVNHAVLDYPNIVRNLGYCVRDVDGNSTQNNILSQGLISVFEFGDPFCVNRLSNRPWLEKIFHCRDMANLLELSENSLVGSIGFTDMHERHFMMVGGRVKVIDLDTYVTSVEPKCGPISEIPIKERLKKRKRQRYIHNCSSIRVNTTCENGICAGMNQKENIFTFTKFFFTKMLDYGKIPPNILEKVRPFLDDMNSLKLNASELRTGFDILLTGNLPLYDKTWGDRLKKSFDNSSYVTSGPFADDY